MASSASIKPAPSAPPGEFDPLEFWLKNRRQILTFLVLALFAAVVYLAWWLHEDSVRTHSQSAFAAASSAEDYKKVADAYPNTLIGGNAMLLLADKQRAAGNLDASIATLRQFIEKQPKHPLAAGAYASLASDYEAQGKPDEALTACKKIATSYPTSFAAPAAYLAQGRIYRSQGKDEEARHAYETLISQFPESQYRADATTALQKLKK